MYLWPGRPDDSRQKCFSKDEVASRAPAGDIMLHRGVTSCCTSPVGRCPTRRAAPVEIIRLLAAAVNLINSVILWQTAKRNKRKGRQRRPRDGVSISGPRPYRNSESGNHHGNLHDRRLHSSAYRCLSGAHCRAAQSEPKMTTPEHLERLQEIAHELTRAHAARDRAIRNAYEAKVPVASIAPAVGLSRMQVHRIVKPARDPQDDE